MVMDLHTELISISNDLRVHVKLLTKNQNHKTSSYYHAFLYVISLFCLFFLFEVKYEKSEICLHVNFSEINASIYLVVASFKIEYFLSY